MYYTFVLKGYFFPCALVTNDWKFFAQIANDGFPCTEGLFFSLGNMAWSMGEVG